MVFVDWKCPTAGPLLGSPPSRLQLPTLTLNSTPTTLWKELETLGTTATLNVDKIYKSGCEGQKSFTDKPNCSPDHAEQNKPFEYAVQYLINMVNLRTFKEEEQYEAICNRMGLCTWMMDTIRMISDPTPDVPWERKIPLDFVDFHTRQSTKMVSATPGPSSAIAGDAIDHTEVRQSEESSEEAWRRKDIWSTLLPA
jgi:hypothetical protein